MANLERHIGDQKISVFERVLETFGEAVRGIRDFTKYAVIVAAGFGIADAQAAPKRKPAPAPKPKAELVLSLSPLDLDAMPITMNSDGIIPLPDTCDTTICNLEIRCKLPDKSYAPPASKIVITADRRGKSIVLQGCNRDDDMLTVGIPPLRKPETPPDFAPLPPAPFPEEPPVPAPVIPDISQAAPVQPLAADERRKFRAHHLSVTESLRLHLAGDHLLELGVASGIRWPIALVGKNTRLGVALEGSYLFGNQAISQTHPLFEPRGPTKMLNADSWAVLGGPYIERTFGNTHGLHFNVNAALTAGAFSLDVNGDTDLAVSRTDPLQLGGIPEYRTTVPATSLCLGAHIGYGRLFLGGEVCADATIAPFQIRAGDPQTHRLTGISAAAGVGFTFPHPGYWNEPME